MNIYEQKQDPISQGLATGLSGFLNTLAEKKFASNAKQKQASGLSTLLGIPIEKAQQIIDAPESFQKEYAKQELARPANEAYAKALGSGSGQSNVTPDNLKNLNPKQMVDLLKFKSVESHQKNIEDIAREKLKLSQEKEERTSQEKLKPFLDQQSKRFSEAKTIYNLANKMKNNLLKNKSKFPGPFTGQLPTAFHRNKDVRKYIANSGELAILLTEAAKGLPSNYKLKMRQEAKAEVGQPIETQLELLDSVMDASKEVFDITGDISKLKDKNNGKYPADLETQITEKLNAKISPLQYPQYYQDDTIIELPEGMFILKDGQWQPYQEEALNG